MKPKTLTPAEYVALERKFKRAFCGVLGVRPASRHLRRDREDLQMLREYEQRPSSAQARFAAKVHFGVKALDRLTRLVEAT